MNHNFQNKIKYIALSIFAVIVVSQVSFAQAAVSTPSLVALVNDSRTKEGLTTLTVNTQLESAALSKAQDMFQNQYFAHVSPSGKTPWDFIKSANYSYVYAGENLAIGYTDSTELHNAWMNSPSHRENIMNPNFREIGLASVDGVYDGAHTTIVVQMFGSQTATAPVVTQPVANNSATVPDPITLSINKDQTTFSPKRIFVGDTVTFKASLTGEAKEIYFTVGTQKILLSGTLEKKAVINQAGELKVTLTAVDQSGQQVLAEIGTLNVAKKVISNASTKNDSAATAALNNTADILKDNLLTVSLSIIVLTLMLSGYFLFRGKKYGKLI